MTIPAMTNIIRTAQSIPGGQFRLVQVTSHIKVRSGQFRSGQVNSGHFRSGQVLPPQTVKSILVWKAKMVRAKVTPAVMPTLIRTASWL